jgi:hypothetical protein
MMIAASDSTLNNNDCNEIHVRHVLAAAIALHTILALAAHTVLADARERFL